MEANWLQNHCFEWLNSYFGQANSRHKFRLINLISLTTIKADFKKPPVLALHYQ